MPNAILRSILLGVNNAQKKFRNKLSAIYAKNVIGECASNVEVEWGVELRYPENIKMGDGVLIKRNTILSGRTDIYDKKYSLELGPSTYIKEFCYIDAKGGSIEIEGYCQISQYCKIGGHGGLKIGKYVMIGPRTYIIPSDHIFSDLELPYLLQGNYNSPIVIEDNVWIGAGCIILANVKIGRNAVVGAGSIVAKDIPSNSVYVNKITPRIIRNLHESYRNTSNRLETD